MDGVYIDGCGPYRFLVDTGSQSNHLDSALARKLALDVTLHFDLQTPSGGTSVQGGRIAKLTVGPAEVRDQEFLYTNFNELPTLPHDVRGILGQEFLTHFDYVLDFQHHRLTFGATVAAGVQTHFRMIYGRMAVTTSLGDLILDSGAEMLFLFRSSNRPQDAQTIGASGARMNVSFDTAPDVFIGGHRYRPAKAQYHAVPAAEEAGLLPASLFGAIYVCNSKQYVVLNPPT